MEMNLMKLLGSKIKIDLPRLISKHINQVLHQDENGHSLPYGFWIGEICEEFGVPILVLKYQLTKDVISRVHHSSLPESMRRINTPLQWA